MSSRNVTLEPSEGPTIVNPTRQQIHDMLERIGDGLDHCILTLGAEHDFLQTAGTKNRLMIQYRDATGMFESLRGDLDVETVERTFLDAASGGTDWKTELGFRFMDMGPGPSAHTTTGAPTAAKAPAEDLLDSVKRAAKDGVKRALKSGLRGLFGGK